MSSDKQNSTTRPPAPVYAIFGEDDFLRRQALDRIVTRAIGPERDGMAYVEFDGDSADLAQVLDEVRTASLLAPLRVVCIREADGFITDHRDALERYAQSPAPTGVLILVCRSWQKTWRLYKKVDALGGNIECATPKARDLPDWVTKRARDTYECSIDPAAARRLVELVGDQLGILDMELAKLSTHVAPQKSIASEHVEELVGASRIEKVFAITDAVARRDAARALALWDQVIATDRQAPYRAVAGLAYGLRRLAEAKRLLEQGLPVWQVAKQVNPWAQPEAVAKQLERFSLPQWRAYLVKLLAIDVGAKTGLGTVQSSVEKLVVEMCA
jgi:DNA polymerase-3 subunit delta